MRRKSQALDAESARCQAELLTLQKDANELEKEEHKYLANTAAFEKKLIDTEEETCMVKSELERVEREYLRLAATNVVNDVFKITCPDRVAAINGFRLGKLPSEDVLALLICPIGQTR